MNRITGATIVVSIAIHVVVGGAALQASAKQKKRRQATTVAMTEKKKPAKKKEEDKPKPPPPAPPRPTAAPKPAPEAKAAPPPVAAPAPVASSTDVGPKPFNTGLELSNDGPGMDVGGPATNDLGKPKQGEHAGDAGKPAAVHPSGVTPKKDAAAGSAQATGGEAPCTEDPTKPEPVAKTEIEYTQEARQEGVEGRLVLKVTVDANGAVTDVQVVNGVQASLDAAAVAAVKQWRFKPALRCGKPIAGGTYTIARRFELGD